MPIYIKSGAAAEYSNRAWSAGEKMVPARADATTNNATAKKWVWECTTAGTTTATPTWPATVTQDTTTVSQGSAVFTARKPGYSSGTTETWAFATPYFDYGVNALAPGEMGYMSHQHTENNSTLCNPINGTKTLPCMILCVNDGAAPPTTLADTAIVNSASGVNIALAGYLYVYGVKMTCGAGTGSSTFSLLNTNSTAGQITLERCELNIGGTGGSSAFTFGNTSGLQHRILLKKTNLQINASTTTVSLHAKLAWEEGTISAKVGVTPTVPLITLGSRSGEFIGAGLDFSTLPGSLSLTRITGGGNGRFVLRNTKVPNSWTGDVADSAPNAASAFAELHNGFNSGGKIQLRHVGLAGTVREELTIVRSGGASDGTPYSWRAVTNANATFPATPLETPELPARWNTVTTAQSVTVEIIHDNATALTNADIWLEVSYLNAAGGQMAVFATNRAPLIGTSSPHDPSTAVWTTTGLVTPYRQKMVVPFIAAEAGFIQVKVCVAKNGPYAVFIDPKIQVS